MPVAGFYYTYGDDTDMMERKWFPDLKKKYPKAAWLRYDATIDDIDIGRLVTEYTVSDLFSQGKVIVIRNADAKYGQIEELASELLKAPDRNNALILIAKGWNKTTRLGKLVKKSFMAREFSKPEIKPFDLLDSLNTKNSTMVLKQSIRLFDADYNPLAMFSLIFGHFLLLRQIKERERDSVEMVARALKQHVYRVKMAFVANRHWSKAELDGALGQLGHLDMLLRTWQYDERMLIQMALIKLCL
jgi:DNA polymerase III delta subunit